MSDLSSEEVKDLKIHKMIVAKSYYELFGLEGAAEIAVIKRAYYDLSRRYHPDRYYRRDIGDFDRLVEDVFSGINKAYEVLSTPESRRDYDQTRESKDSTARSRTRAARRKAREADKKVEDGHEVNFNVRKSRPGKSADQADEKGPQSGKKKRRRRSKRSADDSNRNPVDQLRSRLIGQLHRARRYYQQGQEDMEAGAWVKAAGSLYLATQYDPKNAEYQAAYKEAKRKSDQIRAKGFVETAKTAESYRNIKEAVYNYQQAVACEPEDGVPYFRLAGLLRMYENDPRGALANFRKAVERDPKNVEYRISLADMYMELDMRKNANREYQKVLDSDPKNAEAKAGIRKSRR